MDGFEIDCGVIFARLIFAHLRGGEASCRQSLWTVVI